MSEVRTREGSSPVEWGYRADLLKQGSLSPFVDHLRWIAALCVCAAHLRNLLFPDAAAVAGKGALVSLFYFFTLFATQAVTVFFVVSGLLVGGKIISDLRANRFSTSQYALDRAVRLYVVLIPAIALSLLLATMSSGSGGCRSSVVNVVGNLLFLQNLFVEPLCNNHPLWSLSSEGFYYLIGPALILSVFSKKRAIYIGVTAILVLVLVLTFKVDRQNIAISAPLWFIGMAPWFLRLRVPFYVPGVVFLGLLFASRLHLLGNPILEDYLLAFSIVAMLCSTWNISLPGGAVLAAFSYSLYLVHMPIAIYIKNNIGVLDPLKISSYAIYAAAVAGIIAVAWVFGWAFENRTAKVRKFISGRFLK